jgi:hypothetical protein
MQGDTGDRLGAGGNSVQQFVDQLVDRRSCTVRYGQLVALAADVARLDEGSAVAAWQSCRVVLDVPMGRPQIRRTGRRWAVAGSPSRPQQIPRVRRRMGAAGLLRPAP